MAATTVVKYDTTNIGRIYLRDVGGRNQMGNGQGIYQYGQDQYLIHHDDLVAQIAAGVPAELRGDEDATLINTGNVLMSVSEGVIHKYNKTTGPIGTGAFTVSQVG